MHIDFRGKMCYFFDFNTIKIRINEYILAHIYIYIYIYIYIPNIGVRCYLTKLLIASVID
jgi:hypothetical protein